MSSLAAYVTSREQIYKIARDTKWMIAVSLLLSVILFLPEQIRELYRVVVADVTFVNFNLDDALKIAITLLKMTVPLVVLSVALWAGIYQVTTESLREIPDPTPVTRTIVRLLPPLFGVLPLVASAAAQVLSIPSLSGVETSRELVAGPWDNFGLQLSGTIGRGLAISGVLTLVVALALLATERVTHKWRDASARLNDRYFGRVRFSLVTIILIALLAGLFYLLPVSLPQTIGSFGIVALYALCVVAFCVHLSLLTIDLRFPFIPCLFGLAILFAAFDLNDNHTVRPLDEKDPPAPSESAAAKFKEWYESRPNLSDYDEYPVYVIAAQGGGIYAAYQTAVFLARLYDYCPGFGDHVFAISSVSGGSVGAAAFAAALHARAEGNFQTAGATPVSALPPVSAAADPCPAITEHLTSERAPRTNLEDPGPLEIALRRYFASDFLSPLIGATLFLDFTQTFWPRPVGAFDRARGLELAFEHAEQAFSTGGSHLTQNYLKHRDPARRVPALLINSTDAGSGRRVVIAPFGLDAGGPNPNSSVVRYQDLGRAADGQQRFHAPHIRLSTAASISARFPWVTPAATIPVSDVRFGPQRKIRLVDGGYVDNSGVETALDLVDSLRATVEEINRDAADPQKLIAKTGARYRPLKIKLISLTGGDYSVRSSFALGDVLEPVRALLSTRSSRAYVAIDRATKEFQSYQLAKVSRDNLVSEVNASDFRRGNLTSRFYPLPLGWAMSNRTRQIIEKQSGYFWNCEPSSNFTQSQPTLSEADCIQLLIYHELNRSLRIAASEIAAANLVMPQSLVKPEHQEVADCYRDAVVPGMTRRQAQSLESLLTIWESNPQWSDDRRLAFVLGTIASETANFQVRVENLSFKSAERIKSLWPNRFADVEEAKPYVGNPVELANKVYGDRFGNSQPGDGWRYRGRGMAVLHGREEYGKYGDLVGIDLLENPEWVLNPAVGARVAFHAYFSEPVMQQLAAYLNDDKADWDGATTILKRVHDRSSIADRSKVFYGCIGEARKNGKT